MKPGFHATTTMGDVTVDNLDKRADLKMKTKTHLHKLEMKDLDVDGDGLGMFLHLPTF
jgi:hypothetical protein